MIPAVGQTAPQFSLPDQDGQTRTLADYRGRWVVLYFYPKDDTPGCTTEACQMRDMLPKFTTTDAMVLGVSVDSVQKHAKFTKKFELSFPLLADYDKKVVELYQVWGEKKFMGKTYNGIKRTTFLIDPEGKIAKVYEQVQPDGHAAQVMIDLVELKHSQA